MKGVKSKNTQNGISNQKKVTINAGGDVNTGVINKSEIIDNSWYSIEREENDLLEFFSKSIISYFGEKGSLIFSILTIIFGGILGITNWLAFLSNFKLDINIPHNNGVVNILNIIGNLFHTINLNWILGVTGGILFIFGFFSLNAIRYKKDSQCPKCHKHYAVKEVGTPKEKEIKTSQGYRVTQIRSYLCKFCKKKTEIETNFLRTHKD